MSVISRLREAGFEVYTREDWGTVRPGAYADRAASSSYQLGPNLDYHFLHITVTGDTDLPKDGKAGARQVESFGLSTPPMVSYQMLVTNEGRIFEGQNYRVKGTHTVNDKNVPGFSHDLNREGYAVAIMQNVQDAVTDVQVRAIAAVFAAVELEGHVKRGAPIYPHRKFDWKECPGDKAVARMGEIDKLRTQFVREGFGDDMPDVKDVVNGVLNAKVGTKDDTRRVAEWIRIAGNTGLRTEKGFNAFRQNNFDRQQAMLQLLRSQQELIKALAEGDKDDATWTNLKNRTEQITTRIDELEQSLQQEATELEANLQAQEARDDLEVTVEVDKE